MKTLRKLRFILIGSMILLTVTLSNATTYVIASQNLPRIKSDAEPEFSKTYDIPIDYMTLCRIVEAEAEGEGFEGKLLVAEVVLNRVNSSDFPNSIDEVVFQTNQFSPVTDGRFWSLEISEDTVHAVSTVLKSGVRPQNEDLLFFQNSQIDGWINRNRMLAFTYGKHSFYN